MGEKNSAWRAEPLTWGQGPRVFDVFLEPTCPFSAKAFGKLDETLASAGANNVTLKIWLHSQPWHLFSGVITRCALAASTLPEGKGAARAEVAVDGLGDVAFRGAGVGVPRRRRRKRLDGGAGVDREVDIACRAQNDDRAAVRAGDVVLADRDAGVPAAGGLGPDGDVAADVVGDVARRDRVEGHVFRTDGDVAGPIVHDVDAVARRRRDVGHVAAVVGEEDAEIAGRVTRADQVDRVFLTGGTAFVPAVRRLFEQRFGAGKLAGGGEFVSVAEGLALLGADGRRPAL